MEAGCKDENPPAELVAHASVRAGEAASCRPCTEKGETNRGLYPRGASEAGGLSWSCWRSLPLLSLSKGFVAGPQGMRAPPGLSYFRQ